VSKDYFEANCLVVRGVDALCISNLKGRVGFQLVEQQERRRYETL